MDFNKIIAYIKDIFNSGALDFLEDLKEEDIIPLALILNIDSKNLCPILNAMPKLIKKQISLKEILPKLLPLLIAFIVSLKTKKSPPDDFKGDDLSSEPEKQAYSPTFCDNKNSATEVLSSVADDEILYVLDAYLQSDSPS